MIDPNAGWLTEVPKPSTTKFRVPAEADPDTVNVSVELWPDVIVGGEKLAVIPAGSPEMLSVTD